MKIDFELVIECINLGFISLKEDIEEDIIRKKINIDYLVNFNVKFNSTLIFFDTRVINKVEKFHQKIELIEFHNTYIKHYDFNFRFSTNRIDTIYSERKYSNYIESYKFEIYCIYPRDFLSEMSLKQEIIDSVFKSKLLFDSEKTDKTLIFTDTFFDYNTELYGKVKLKICGFIFNLNTIKNLEDIKKYEEGQYWFNTETRIYVRILKLYKNGKFKVDYSRYMRTCNLTDLELDGIIRFRHLEISSS